MAKKMITMKFEPEFLAEIDAAAKEANLDRTAFVEAAVREGIEMRGTRQPPNPPPPPKEVAEPPPRPGRALTPKPRDRPDSSSKPTAVLGASCEHPKASCRVLGYGTICDLCHTIIKAK